MFDIVIALYNKEKFVEATIDSVLRQSYKEWRLFVVDDGSSDRGAELVRNYRDTKITLIQQENRGVGPARNAGIRAGNSDWIAFLDADDLWNADHLEELDALRRAYPEAVLAGCGFTRFSGTVNLAQRSPRPSTRRLARYFAECASGRELFFTSSAAVRRSALDVVGDFEPLPGNEDVEMWARLALHGPVAVSDSQTVNYRVGTGGITDEGMGGRKFSAKPTGREELSSTIPTLDRALPHVTDPALRDDIIAYMDSRIGLHLVAAVLEGDIRHARQMRALYAREPKGKARVAAALITLPAPLARAVVAGGTRVRRLVSR